MGEAAVVIISTGATTAGTLTKETPPDDWRCLIAPDCYLAVHAFTAQRNKAPCSVNLTEIYPLLMRVPLLLLTLSGTDNGAVLWVCEISWGQKTGQLQGMLRESMHLCKKKKSLCVQEFEHFIVNSNMAVYCHSLMMPICVLSVSCVFSLWSSMCCMCRTTSGMWSLIKSLLKP